MGHETKFYDDYDHLYKEDSSNHSFFFRLRKWLKENEKAQCEGKMKSQLSSFALRLYKRSNDDISLVVMNRGSN